MADDRWQQTTKGRVGKFNGPVLSDLVWSGAVLDLAQSLPAQTT